MSIAPRPAKWKSHSRPCDGQPRLFGTAIVGLAGCTDERRAARVARLRHRPPAGALLPLREHRPDDLGDHVAGAPHDHRVALANVLATNLVLVVQGCVGDRHAAHGHRIEHGERGDLARPPGVHVDLLEQRGPLLGRELERDRPSRRVRRRAEVALLIDAVDLDDDAVDLPIDRVTLILPMPEEGLDVGDRAPALGRRRDRQARLGRPLEEVEVRVERHALGRAERVHPQAQRPRGGHLRVLLAERPRGGVPRVGERALLRRAEPLVQLFERLDGQVHLAADLDDRRWVLDREAMRHAFHRADVGGDVLAGPSVATRRRADEPASLVGERARHAVDLQLADEPVGRVAEAARDPLVPRLELGEGEGVVQRQHRRTVLDRREQVGGGAPHELRRRIGRDQLGERVLEPSELVDQLVVLGVAHLGIVEHVVPVGVVVDLLPQLLHPHLGLGARAFVAAHPAISTPPATPIRSPTTTTPPEHTRHALQVVQRHAEAVGLAQTRLDARGGGIGEHAALRDDGEPVGPRAAATPTQRGRQPDALARGQHDRERLAAAAPDRDLHPLLGLDEEVAVTGHRDVAALLGEEAPHRVHDGPAEGEHRARRRRPTPPRRPPGRSAARRRPRGSVPVSTIGTPGLASRRTGAAPRTTAPRRATPRRSPRGP